MRKTFELYLVLLQSNVPSPIERNIQRFQKIIGRIHFFSTTFNSAHEYGIWLNAYDCFFFFKDLYSCMPVVWVCALSAASAESRGGHCLPCG